MKKKLGLLAVVATAATALTPLAASPSGAAGAGQATYRNGTWYCFGKRATKTVPDVPAHNDKGPDGTVHHFGATFYSTGNRDVIIGTDGDDEIWDVVAGDVVCSRGGNDTILVGADVNPRTGWNRIRVDAGAGNDWIEVDGDSHDWDNPNARWADFEVHTGPGDDGVWGEGGNNQLFGDGGRNRYRCGEGHDTVYYTTGLTGAEWTPYTNGPYAYSDTCEKLTHYKGYGKGFSEFRPSPTTVTTIRSATTTTRPPTPSTVPGAATTTTR